MKNSPLLLLVSLAADVVLAWFVVRDRTSPAAISFASRVSTSVALEKNPPASLRNPGATASADARAAQRDRLSALGFSEEAVRAAIRAGLEAPRLARQRVYLAQAANATPWWQGGIVAQNFTREQVRELRGLRRAEHDELVRLFGPTGAVTAAEAEAFAFLPLEKASRLAALEHDYAALRREATEGGPGNLAPADATERIKLLGEERDRDVAALLSPEERTELELRQSVTGRNLASRFEYFDSTDAETRAIYALQKAWDDQYRPTGFSSLASQDRAARDEATKKLDADIRAALGTEPFADWQRSSGRLDFRALVDLQRRFNLPQGTFDTVVQIPTQLSAASLRVVDNPVLSVAEKKVALIKLAADTRAQVRTVLGADLGDAYLAASGRMWVDHLDRGMAYEQTPGGTSVRGIQDLPNPFAPTTVRPPPKP